MRKTYVRVIFSSEGESPKQVIERMTRIGAVPVGGDYDFELTLGDDERIFDRIEKIHKVLKGARVRYSITTRLDVGEEVHHDAEGKRRVVHYFDHKPVEMKKAMYKAKLVRWKEMGLDVTELEPLLEQDIEKFKEASKNFLRTHVDELSEIKDRPPENLMDGEVLARVDEGGKTLAQLVAETGYSEDVVTISLGRLISAGSVKREQTGSTEKFSLIPPPAPQLRKAMVVVPANTLEEARKRAYSAIPPEGILAKDIGKEARMPREQVMRALETLLSDGRIKVSKDQGKEMYFRA